MFVSASISDVDIKTFGGKWRQNVKKTAWFNAQELSYPHLAV